MTPSSTTEAIAASRTPSVAVSRASVERGFRRGLWAATILTAVALLISVGVMLWSQNEFSPAESVISAQSQMLASNGTLYYDLNRFPYTICAYMPVFYSLEAGMIRLGFSAFAAGRWISLAALLGLIATCWRTTLLYTGNRYSAWIAAILVAASPLMLFWGVVAQTDLLAVSFAAMAFYKLSRFTIRNESSLLAIGLFAGLALFTKQTMIAIPTAVVISLWMSGDRRNALKFALWFGASSGALVLGLNWISNGHFLADTVFANMNPLSWSKLGIQLQYLGSVSAGMLFIVAVSARKLIQGRYLSVAVYLACASLVFLITAPKRGSDTNYQLELTVILAIASAVGIHQLDFFNHYFRQSKSWITLLLIPLGVHLMVGYRTGANMMLARAANEQILRAEIERLRPYYPESENLPSAQAAGLILSTDYNSLARLGHRIDVEPLIYGWLVKARLVDPEPVRKELAAGRFTTVILDHDVFAPHPDWGEEITALPQIQLDEIRKHYRLTEHIPSPYLDGVFVYKPIPDAR